MSSLTPPTSDSFTPVTQPNPAPVPRSSFRPYQRERAQRQEPPNQNPPTAPGIPAIFSTRTPRRQIGSLRSLIVSQQRSNLSSLSFRVSTKYLEVLITQHLYSNISQLYSS